jgi:nucleotide-binding universal stress UspA family protein
MIMEIRHLLVPTDFSESSKYALNEAVGLAQVFGARLTLLHVVELPSYVTDRSVNPVLARGSSA